MPKFLRHALEHGRTVGFVIERIEDARHPDPGDLSLCQQVLSKLHGLGYKHGDINRHNFLIKGHTAFIIDIGTMEPCTDSKLLAAEFESLAEVLSDESGKGGSRSATSSEIAEVDRLQAKRRNRLLE